jgi:hypothetical protein
VWGWLPWVLFFALSRVGLPAAGGPISPPWFAILLPTLAVAGAFVFTTRYAAAVSRRAAEAFPQASPRQSSRRLDR